MGKNVIISTLPNISQNYLPKVNTSNIFANSLVYDDGSSVLINTTTASAFRLDVNGTARTGALTLTGALSGTSATFSATYSAGGTVNIMQWQRSGGAVAADMTYNDANTSMNFGTSTAHSLNIKTGGTTALSISSTGAATFSSSVAVGAGMTIGISGTNDISWGTAGGIKLSRTNVGPEYALSQRWTGTLAYIDIASSTQWNGGVTILPNGGGNVGIGTTTPFAKLEVVGGNNLPPSTGTQNYTVALRDPTSMVVDVGGSILLQGFKTSNTAIGNFAYIAGKKENGTAGNEAGYLSLGTFNSSGIPAERMRITSGGITQLKPATNELALEVFVGATSTGAMIGDANNFIIGGQTGKGLVLCTNNLGQEKMRITTGGNVGIGTTSPSGKLDIAGSLGNFYVGTSGAELFFTRNENNDFLANAGSSAGIRFGAQSYLRFDTGTTLTERMRITSGGNVLIGITGEYPYQGGALLRINKEQNTGTNIQINNQANNASAAAHVIFSTYGNGWTIGMGSSSSSSGNSFYFSPDPSAALNKVATLTTAGVWSTSGGGTSDRRTKNNIQYITENVLNKISELKPVEFEFLLCPNKKRRGFIAQDVLETTLPDLVLGNGDEVNGTYGLDYDGILALAVKAIQEQQAQIEVQKADIESLKALINK